MPELNIEIGGRTFEVSCQAGEESFLQSAAGMLDEEAQVLSDQIGRMPEGRMLLMAGLMLADRTAATEDKVKELEAELARLRAAEPERVEVPVVPQSVTETLAELAARAEALAARVEDQLAGSDSAGEDRAGDESETR